jgi:DMSO/TMAO reductase YedYZ molybdopterin-dependent catalytic subunit
MAAQVKVLSASPENRETPLAEAQSWVTPNRWFFVRSHFDKPQVDAATWRLAIGGCVRRPVELSLEQLNSLPQRSIFSTLECAGNGRSFLSRRQDGVQWTAGAVGHAEWSGVPLKYVLERVEPAKETLEFIFQGADQGVEKGAPGPISFARSLPLSKAMHEDTLLATRMNGEELEPSHGAPVRLIVPGWYGVASVKWLSRIEAMAEPFNGFFQTVKYTMQRPTGRGVLSEMIGPMPVKSEIIRPAEGEACGLGVNRVFGMAWAGEHAVAAVEVSTDGGRTWGKAELVGPQAKYSWTLWEYLWEVEEPGDYELMARAISASGEVQAMQHDYHRGGYLITYCRPMAVHAAADERRSDTLGDFNALRREMAAVASRRFSRRLDAELEMELLSGAGM